MRGGAAASISMPRETYPIRRPIMNWVWLRKWRWPSPWGHIALRTAVLAASARSGSNWDCEHDWWMVRSDFGPSNDCALAPAWADDGDEWRVAVRLVDRGYFPSAA